jgi:O-succinylbenzoic acid--CoA ligase
MRYRLHEVSDWLSTAAQSWPGRVFVAAPDGDVTFAELDGRVTTRAGELSPPGPHRLRPTADLASVVEIFAAWRAGITAFLVDPRLPELPVSGDTMGAQTVIFTSGSGGRSKGVRLTVDNWAASAAATAAHLRTGPDEVWLCVLPISHVGGLSILVRSVIQGSTVVLEPRFDAARVAALLKAGVVTLTSMVPAMLRRVLDADGGPYRAVKAALIGGGPVASEVLERAAAARLACLPTYGMTETASHVAAARPGDLRLRPLAGAEVAVIGGRIAVRGAMVSPGYVGMPDRAPGEWLLTNDLGQLHTDGSLRVLGRADDVIITGGDKVDPAVVEEVLAGAPGVTEVAVVGLPDPIWGHMVAAALVSDSSPEVVEWWCREHLPRFMVPRRWIRVDSIPRTSLGKVIRSEVAAWF